MSSCDHRDKIDDVQNYMADLQTIAREADPAHGERKRREAQRAFEQTATLEAEAKRPPPQAEIKALVKARSAEREATRRAKSGLPRGLVYVLAVLAVVAPAALVIFFIKISPSSLSGGEPSRVMGPGAAKGSDATADAPIVAPTGAAIGSATDTSAGTAPGTATGSATGTATALPGVSPGSPPRATPEQSKPPPASSPRSNGSAAGPRRASPETQRTPSRSLPPGFID